MQSRQSPPEPATEAQKLLRLDQVLQIVPLGRTTIYAKIRAGELPAPVRLGKRAVAWRSTDIAEFIDRLATAQDAEK